jgi:hypothetical protein
MNRLALPLAAFAMALPLAAFAASPAPSDAAGDAAATALRHAANDLHTHPAAAANWLERAETDLLNRTSLQANGSLQPGAPIKPDATTENVIAARKDLQAGKVAAARDMIQASRKDLSESPRG